MRDVAGSPRLLSWLCVFSVLDLALSGAVAGVEPAANGAQAQGFVPPTSYQFDHMGIPVGTDVPVNTPRPGELYSSTFKMYISGGEDSAYRVQWLRFEAGTPLDPLLTTLPHIAFKVPSIDAAIKGQHVLLQPYFPFPGYRVAIIEDHGAPIEFIETKLPDEQIWMGSKDNTYIHPGTDKQPRPADSPAKVFVPTTRYQFHHMGLPVSTPRPGEHYSSTFKMYTSGGGNSPYRVEWLRFEPDSPLDPLLKTLPHLAFKVPSIDAAIKGQHVLLQPYFPFPGFRVAAIEDHGAPIEFIETNLSEQEIWYGDKSNTYIFPRK